MRSREAVQGKGSKGGMREAVEQSVLDSALVAGQRNCLSKKGSGYRAGRRWAAEGRRQVQIEGVGGFAGVMELAQARLERRR